MTSSAAGIVLTGGASRRMGRDKATMVVHGESLARRAARVLSEVCEPVIEVGLGATGLRCVREDPPGAGPLAALIAGARALDTDLVVVLACDLPFVDAPLLRLLADWPGTRSVIPVAGGRLQYACARYGPAALHEATARLRAGAAALAGAADAGCDHLTESTWRAVAPLHAFDDLDTPDDLRRFGLT